MTPHPSNPKRPTAPPLADRLLGWFVAPHLLEALQGDLHEEFDYQVERVGERRARWRYWREVLGFIKPRFIARQKLAYSTPNNTDMLRSYLKIALRGFWKNGTVSVINVLGLAFGLVVTLLITLYVMHEYSFDRFNQNGEQLVLAGYYHDEGEHSYGGYTTSYRFGEEVKRRIPGVDGFARITREETSVPIRTDAKQAYFESGFRFADASLLHLFSFPMLLGDSATALTRPGTVLLTERTARKYFGTQNPVGRILTYNKKYPLEIVGVVKNPPANSTIQFDFLGDMFTQRSLEEASYRDQMDEKTANKWINNIGTGGSYETYLLLNRQANPEVVIRQIPALVSPGEELSGSRDSYVLRPLFSLHFAVYSPQSPQRVLIFSIIAGLILVLALVNYVNLTTARATIRAKEVSIRKTIGAARKALIAQFYLESALYVTMAFGLALLLFMVLHPLFYDTLHLTIDIPFLTSRYVLLPTALFFVVSILVSGSYPALLLSRFSPIQTLKGGFSQTGRTARLRQGLTVFQFAISIALIVGSIVVQRQLTMVLKKDLGLNRERVIALHLDPNDGLGKHYKAIRGEVSQLNDVEAVTASSLPLYGGYLNSWQIKRVDSGKRLDVCTFPVDQEFIKTLAIRWASRPPANDSLRNTSQIVVNETAARQLGISRNNYGQTLDLGGGMTKTLVGIIKDFNFVSLNHRVGPMALFTGQDTTARDYLYIKIAQGASTPKTLSAIQRVYDQYKTDKPFAVTFLDETYRRQYETELATGQIIVAFTAFAVLIACLGLFGLATFTAEQRTKEIGVRKVLGASLTSIVMLLSKDFLKLVLIALVLASPLAYYTTQQWLSDFAYRVDVSWWVFALAGLLALGIALLTVSFQSIRAALMNPVKALRSE